jgi:hypothetical protein
MCDRSLVDSKKRFMSKNMFKKYINEIVSDGTNPIVLPFWRGESCTHPNFVDLLEYALDKEVRIHLSTNGHFTGKQFIDIFYKCEFITFSIHNDRCMKSTLEFIENKPNWSNVVVQVSFVDTEKTTSKYLTRFVESPALQGLDSVRLYKQHTINGSTSIKDVNFEQGACNKLKNTLVLDTNGKVSRCSYVWDDDNRDSNSLSIQDSWNNLYLTTVRNNYPDNICSRCDQWSGNTKGESWKMDKNDIVHYATY